MGKDLGKFNTDKRCFERTESNICLKEIHIERQYETTYRFLGDVMERVVSSVGEDYDRVICEKYDTDLTELREFLEAKRAGQTLEPVVRARWIEYADGLHCCSRCKTNGSPAWKRCPICEAKMN